MNLKGVVKEVEETCQARAPKVTQLNNRVTRSGPRHTAARR